MLQGEISAPSLTNGVLRGHLKDVKQESSSPLVLLGGLSTHPAGESRSLVPSEQLPAPWVCLCADLVTRWIRFSASGGCFSQCTHFKICTGHVSKGWFQIPSKSVPKFPFTSVGTVLLLEQSE